MQKLLLFILVLWAIYSVRRYLQGQRRVDQEPVHEEARLARSEVMRECAHCRVLVPESESIQVDGKFYCSPEHARGEEG